MLRAKILKDARHYSTHETRAAIIAGASTQINEDRKSKSPQLCRLRLVRVLQSTATTIFSFYRMYMAPSYDDNV